jgi:hypothetical protein
MEKTLRLFLLSLVGILVIWVTYLHHYKVPTLQKELNAYESFEPDTVTVTKLIFGTVDSTKIIEEYLIRSTQSGDTEEVNSFDYENFVQEPTPESPVDPQITRTQTTFQDTLIKGTIYNTFIGQGEILYAGVKYFFKKPIYTTSRVDTLIIENDIPVLKFKERDPGFRLLVGFASGAMVSKGFEDPVIGFGPEVELLTPRDNALSYKYDVINKMH